jgi:plastocyanin
MRSARTVTERTQHWAFAGVVTLGVLTGCGSEPETMSSAASPESGMDTTMHIIDCAFVPPIVFAHPGDPVTIVNLDSVAHRLTGHGFASVSVLGGGGAYSFQAPVSGTMAYNCDYQAVARGQVFVI